MSSELYNVFFDGVAEGRDIEGAKLAFAQLFRVDVSSAERFFSAKGAVLKSNVDAVTADKYIARLEVIGVIARKSVVEITPQSPTELSLEPIDANPPPVVESSALTNVNASASLFNNTTKVDDSSERIRRVPFVFAGNGFEYFKIWIVNVLLSIVTLGIYSAWAKVRNKQYFYGNTSFDGASFEYTAEPLKILKGRAIAAAFFIAYAIAAQFSLIAAKALLAVLSVLSPWIIVASLRFNARHSSYRNINFRFVGETKGAMKALLLWPALGFLSLGFLLPVAWKRKTQYIVNNHRYGTEPFKFDVGIKQYYKMYFGLFVLSCVLFSIAGFFLGFCGVFAGHATEITGKILAFLPAVAVGLLCYSFLAAYFSSRMANIRFNNTEFGGHHFSSNWAVKSYAKLLLTNTLGILFTLGLFIPFAKIRTAAYKAAHTEVIVKGDLEGFIAAELEQSNSLGEGVHDIFDIDISL